MTTKITGWKKQEYNGKTSYSVTTEDGKNGLVTADHAAKCGGKVEEVKEGDVVNIVFEDVPKKQGGGTWTAAKFPDWEQKPAAGGGFAGRSGGGSYQKEDIYGKICNTAAMTAGSIVASSPAGTCGTVVEIFNELADAMVLKYEAVKK